MADRVTKTYACNNAITISSTVTVAMAAQGRKISNDNPIDAMNDHAKLARILSNA